MSEDIKKFKDSLPEKTNKELDEQLAALALEEKQMDLVIKRQKVAEIKAQMQAKLDNLRIKEMATQQFLAQRRAIQDHCLHRKGGRGPEAVIQGQGDSAMFCVAKHVMPAGGTWVLCMRCGKEWHPAKVEISNGRLVHIPASIGWQDAVNFPTDNTTSGSSRFFIQETHAPA